MSRARLFTLLSVLLLSVSLLRAESAATRWALVTGPMAPMRSHPAHAAELDTQYLLGTPVRVDSLAGEWILATGPDGYQGFLPIKSVSPIDSVELRRWQQAPRYLVVDNRGAIMRDTIGNLISPLPFGAIVEVDTTVQLVVMPDGRKGIAEGLMLSFDSFRTSRLLSDTLVCALSRTMMGVPYLWGGTTSAAIDCSGLTSLCYRMAGVIIPRNASAQSRVGCEVTVHPDSLRPADLIFMGPDPHQSRVTHVGIYLGDSILIHSSGHVRLNSIDAQSPDFVGRAFVVARRYLDADGCLIPGAGVNIADHPWYFPVSAGMQLPELLK